MRVTVYGSSSPRTPQAYLDTAADCGRLIAASGWILVNGAGSGGCMGALNDGCLAAGGRVEGVILRQFLDQGLVHPELQDVQVAETMRERKRLLASGSQAYLVLPGGPGTWEELWEIAVERQIGVSTAPLVLIDVDGFYAGFIAQLRRAYEDGLLYGPQGALLQL
ncbi:MAG: TIGR00730 family Rossman fold protein, partial [Planctomycetota bacterium]